MTSRQAARPASQAERGARSYRPDRFYRDLLFGKFSTKLRKGIIPERGELHMTAEQATAPGNVVALRPVRIIETTGHWDGRLSVSVRPAGDDEAIATVSLTGDIADDPRDAAADLRGIADLLDMYIDDGAGLAGLAVTMQITVRA